LRQLKPSVEAWRRNPDDDGTLLRGGPLAGAEVWLSLRGDDLSAEERSYIEASVASRESIRLRDEKGQRIIRRFARLVGVAIIVAVFQGGFHLWVKSNNKEATWTMGWSALYTRGWLLFHSPPEPPDGAYSERPIHHRLPRWARRRRRTPVPSHF